MQSTEATKYKEMVDFETEKENCMDYVANRIGELKKTYRAGNGKIDSSLQLIDKIENRIFELTKEIKGEIQIATHPFICSHINKGWFFSSIKSKWQRKYSRKIIVSSDDRLHLLQYSVLKN